MALYKVYNATKEKFVETVLVDEIEDAFGYILNKYNIETVKRVKTNIYECRSKAGNTFVVTYKPDIVTLDDLIQELNKLRETYGGDKKIKVFGNYGAESEIEEVDYSKNEDVIYISVDIG